MECGGSAPHPDRGRLSVGHVFQSPLPAARGEGQRSARVSATQPVYAYASIVRNDSGDAEFIVGTPAARPDDSPLLPACASPAPLRKAAPNVAAEGWLVMFKSGNDARATANALGAEYGSTPTVYLSINGFFAHVAKETVAALRCEAPVNLIEQNQFGRVTRR